MTRTAPFVGVDHAGCGYRASMDSRGSTGVAEMVSATRLVEDALAAWRIVRLVRSDYLTQPVRDRVYDLLDGDAVGEDEHVGTCVCGHPKEQHAAPVGAGSPRCHRPGCPCGRYRPIASARVARLRHPKLATLLECPYCLGVWAAGAVLVVRALHANWLVRLLAVSAVASELAIREH